MESSFDLAVIGSGPAGYPAAIRAAQLGMSVVIFESGNTGGTCLNRGCIPTKTLLHAALLRRELSEAASYGVGTGEASVDLQRLYSKKDEVVERLRGGVEQLMKANKITVVRGRASVAAAGLVVCGADEFRYNKILIATGGKPVLPPIEGIDSPGVVTSDGLLGALEAAPQKLAIIGGGVIGMELATVFNALGSEVVVIEALERILPTADREISQNLTMLLKRRGVEFHTGARVKRFYRDGGLRVVFEEKETEFELSTDLALVATGRRPNTEGLFFGDFSVKTERGAIVTDDNYQTSEEDVYAAGDVRFGAVQLAHAATAEGINAVCAMNNLPPEYDMALIPSCVYTSPEIAFAGLNEQTAAERGISLKCGKALMSSNGKTVLCGGERGFVKLYFDSKSEILVGASLMCERATDIIGELLVAMRAGVPLNELAKVVRPHPTFEEAVGEAARAVK